jgi:fatty aldehyde-generating acyl-ACP reductase
VILAALSAAGLTARTDIKELLLIARNQERIQRLQEELGCGVAMDLDTALRKADIVVWVASMAKGVEVAPSTLKRPCLMIDGGYPKNLDQRFNYEGVHVLKGGIVEHSLDIDWRMMSIVIWTCRAAAVCLLCRGDAAGV